MNTQQGGFKGNLQNQNFQNNQNNRGFKGPDQNRAYKEKKIEEATKKFLEGHKFKGKDFCINYNLRDERNEPKCKDRRCMNAHNCGFIPRGETKPCGKPHPKFEHFKF